MNPSDTYWLNVWKEKEQQIIRKMKERKDHNLELGKLPVFLKRARQKINEIQMRVK